MPSTSTMTYAYEVQALGAHGPGGLPHGAAVLGRMFMLLSLIHI